MYGTDCTKQSHCFSKIQRFSGGSEEEGAIFQPSNDSKAYWVGGDFWRTFQILNSQPGDITVEPISDREEADKWWKQKFSSQYSKPGCTAIFKIRTQIFYVDGEIGCHYFYNEDGEKGRLGFPSKNFEIYESYESDFWTGKPVLTRQYFENGCIQHDTKRNISMTIIPLAKCMQ